MGRSGSGGRVSRRAGGFGRDGTREGSSRGSVPPAACPLPLRVLARLPAPERRRQLLDSALDVFAARGFHGASMNDVADAAGVTKPVLYQHFESKRRLFVELLEDVGSRLGWLVAEATASAT